MQSHEAFNFNDRYGMSKGGRWKGFAWVFAIAGITWITWAGLHHSNPPMRVQLISFTVDSDRAVTVRYSVDHHEFGAVSVCTLIARDYEKNIVGQIDQEVTGNKSRIEMTTVVPTRSNAVNADVSGCRPK